MSTAPKLPTKRLFAAICTAGGTALGMLGLLSIGHFVYGNIPRNRLTVYSLAVLAVAVVAAVLAVRYLVQKWRRDAWWDGHAACDDPDADTMPLRRIQAELAELTEAVHSLADAAGRPRPQPRAEPMGSTYTSRAVQDDTVMMTTGHGRPTQVQVADRPPVDPEAEARAQGYAEGYVDGIARRTEGDQPN